MSVQPPRKGWNVLGAIFMSCGGLLLVALGGICSIALGGSGSSTNGAGPLILLSLGLVAGGVLLIYYAVKLLRE